MSRSSLAFSSFLVTLSALALAACSKHEEAPPVAAEPPPPAAEAAPPPPPAKPEDSHAFKIGELSAWAVRDGALEFPNDQKIFGLGKTPDEVNAVLTAANLPDTALGSAVIQAPPVP